MQINSTTIKPQRATYSVGLLVAFLLCATSCTAQSVNPMLPDPSLHPGVFVSAIRQDNIASTICVPGYARSVRPAYAYTRQLKHDQMQAEGHHGERYSAFELDHLVPLSLGGDPTDPRNIWLEPRGGDWGAEKKDILEYILWIKVCDGRVGLQAAQRAIAQNWISAYRRFVRPEDPRPHFKDAD